MLPKQLKRVILISTLMISSQTFAAPVPSALPTTAEPTQIQKRLTGNILPPLKGGHAITGSKLEKPTGGQAKLKFKLNKVQIIGNTVFRSSDLKPTYQDYLNKQITVGDLQTITYNITVKYRDSGYILSRAILPPQTVKDGVVKIQIIEGFIDHVTVSGDPGRAKELIQAYGNHITESRPVNAKVLERYVLLANDLAGYTVRAVITPSKTVPAAADLNLVTERKRVSSYVSYDNYGTRYLGPKEVTLGGSAYSVFTGGDNNSARYVLTSIGKEMRFYELTHLQPVGTKGTKFLLGVDYTRTNPQFTLSPFNIIGRSTWVFADFSYPIIRSRANNFVVHGEGNYLNSFSTITQLPYYQDRIRSLDLGINYEGFDSHSGMNDFVFDVIQGFSIMGADKHTLQSRPFGNTGYTRFDFTLSRLQGLTQRLSFLLAAQGQYCSKPLLASEQYAYGGPNYGRGYDPAQITGDRGIAAKGEFRVDTLPSLKLLNGVQYYIFYDIGRVRNWDTINQFSQISAASAGVGARFVFMPQLTGNFFIAKPLTLPVSTLVLEGQNGNQFRTFFSVTASFS